MDLEEILKEVDDLDRESKAIKEDLLKLCWYMRGGVTLDDVYWMSFEDRQMISELVKENLETTKKSGLPFFQNFIEILDSNFCNFTSSLVCSFCVELNGLLS